MMQHTKSANLAAVANRRIVGFGFINSLLVFCFGKAVRYAVCNSAPSRSVVGGRVNENYRSSAKLMTLRHIAKRWVNKMLSSTLDLKVYSVRAHGREDIADIARVGKTIATIFDVGANIGQSALKFRDAFPSSQIYCFEPVASTFSILQEAVAVDRNTSCHRLALGSAAGTAEIYVTSHDTMSSLVKPDSFQHTETVPVSTVDQFAGEHGISRIDLLKIDAEGYDLEVLRGASGMLKSGAVSFVLVEVGFYQDSSHVLFDDVRNLLHESGFYLFGIYDQQPEWTGENRLRYVNACFFNQR